MAGLRRMTNSVARCWASAALPPFPHRRIFFFFRRAFLMRSIAFEISGSSWSSILCFVAALSLRELRMNCSRLDFMEQPSPWWNELLLQIGGSYLNDPVLPKWYLLPRRTPPRQLFSAPRPVFECRLRQ